MSQLGKNRWSGIVALSLFLVCIAWMIYALVSAG
jgi:hypothetical protein